MITYLFIVRLRSNLPVIVYYSISK